MTAARLAAEALWALGVAVLVIAGGHLVHAAVVDPGRLLGVGFVIGLPAVLVATPLVWGCSVALTRADRGEAGAATLAAAGVCVAVTAVCIPLVPYFLVGLVVVFTSLWLLAVLPIAALLAAALGRRPGHVGTDRLRDAPDLPGPS